MQKSQFLQHYLALNETLDSEKDFDCKMSRIEQLLEDLPSIKKARIVSVNEEKTGPVCIDQPQDYVDATEEWPPGEHLLVPIRSTTAQRSALLISGSKGITERYDIEINLVCGKVGQLYDQENLSRRIRELEASDLRKSHFDESNFSYSETLLLIERLHLPFYITDLEGHFIYANQIFFDLTHYSDLARLNRARGFFVDPDRRQEELVELKENGRVEGIKLNITLGNGQKLTVTDSLVLLDSYICGVFLDITELTMLNQEIWDALQIQQTLNDRIIEATDVLRKTQTVAIKSFARLAEYRDAETGEHLQRIGQYSKLLAAEVKEKNPFNYAIGAEYINDIAISSMLHDIGKVGVPDQILLKPGKLDQDEWIVMKNHTVWGWAILNNADKELGEQSFLTLACSAALHHHERFDGKGYPHQLAGEDIPLSARIVALADVYDALTTKRPYKDPWTHDMAVEEILSQKGSQFCPILTEMFVQLQEAFRQIRTQFPE